MTPETKTPTRAEALSWVKDQKRENEIVIEAHQGRLCAHPKKNLEILDFIEAALATDAPIVEGEFERIASDARSYAGNFLKHEDYKQREADIVAVRNALYAQGRTQSVGVDDLEAVARAMMETVFHDIDVQTAPLDWTGNDVWGCDFKAMAQAAIELLSAAPPVTGGAWLPIESAPRDGTVCLICVHEFGDESKPLTTVVAKFRDGHWREELNEDHFDDSAWCWPPTNWQPLPAPPSSQTRGG